MIQSRTTERDRSLMESKCHGRGNKEAMSVDIAAEEVETKVTSNPFHFKFLPFSLIFFQQVFIEYILCARPYSRC